MLGFFVLLVLAASAVNLSTSYFGFAVDKDNNLYIGRRNAICVISADGDDLRTIDPQTPRGYEFTIDNNTLYVLASTYLYTMDLDGNIMKEREEYCSMDHSKTPNFSRKRFIATDGSLYVMKNPWLRPTIYRITDMQRTKVFEMPGTEYAARIIFIGFPSESDALLHLAEELLLLKTRVKDAVEHP